MIEAALLCLIVGISDGDTIRIRCPDRPQIAVRLAEIDAPERSQPFRQRSTALLSTLCFRKQAEVRTSAPDRYGRSVARVTCAGTDANAAMVRAGPAWAHTRYLTDPQIQSMKVAARRERLGLWAGARPVPPWEWRKAPEQGACAGVPASRTETGLEGEGQCRPLTSATCYLAALREARISAAWLLLSPRRAAIAGKWLARGRALPASQL